ncbi:MAG: ClpXP protease specificity-enhancing factor [Advenella sp.]|uniref:ClpXP protease specificity-enhancing factor n=1 Tax=Advenella sp. TaxID=1872388 RepID=UPI00258A386D|nr:ClpXP protease specificity-enhancing factor [Advenella sp.]MDD3758626.1 ClpXP protease specificity-enhancing factor [Advenella sp.]
MTSVSTKPYLLRALYEWCTDSGYTPHLVVKVDQYCQVPQEYVRDGYITLNIGALATGKLSMENDWISFNARFNGVSRSIAVPVSAVSAIYARETQEGMQFETEEYVPDQEIESEDISDDTNDDDPPSGGAGKAPWLKVVK